MGADNSSNHPVARDNQRRIQERKQKEQQAIQLRRLVLDGKYYNVQLHSVTWNKDSFGLFDYQESQKLIDTKQTD
jgi:hypothetical protein